MNKNTAFHGTSVFLANSSGKVDANLIIFRQHRVSKVLTLTELAGLSVIVVAKSSKNTEILGYVDA